MLEGFAKPPLKKYAFLKKISELDDPLFECEMAKTKIKLILPIYLGYHILQYAKLKMLNFYFDCVDKLCHRSDFVLCEMDTFSLYNHEKFW